MVVQKNAYVDVNPVILTSEFKIVLAKRREDVVGGGQWHLPGGRVLLNETFLMTLKRVASEKTGLQIEFLGTSMKDSLVGIYDDPKRDPREHVIGFAFLCKIADGEVKPGDKVKEIRSFSEFETRDLQIAFDHREMIRDAFAVL